MTIASDLYDKISAVAPIFGVSIGQNNDPSTWRVDFDPSATDAQRLAANAVVAAFDPSAPTVGDVHAESSRRMLVMPFGGKKYQFDAESQGNIAGGATLALAAIISGAQSGDHRWASPDADFVWFALDNTPTRMDAQTMLAFAQAAASWKREHIYAGRAIKDLSPIPADYAADGRWPD
jgi:hypothetical protein